MQATLADTDEASHARHRPRLPGVGLHRRAQALHARATTGGRKHLQQLRQQGRQRLARTHLRQALAQRQRQVQPALAGQVFLGCVIQHDGREVDNHETVGTVCHLVVGFTRCNERALQQVQAPPAPLHLELQLALQRQYPLRIVVAIQAGGLAVLPQVEDRAHAPSVCVLGYPCNAGAPPHAMAPAIGGGSCLTGRRTNRPRPGR